jgi:DivIVA domain-containing protein
MPKIMTAQDVRNQTFTTRKCWPCGEGYDTDEVDGFLELLAAQLDIGERRMKKELMQCMEEKEAGDGRRD